MALWASSRRPLRVKSAVRLATRFVNVKSYKQRSASRGTPKAESVVALIDHSRPIAHFSIDGWIASFCAFGTASINSASALLKPAVPADSPR